MIVPADNSTIIQKKLYIYINRNEVKRPSRYIAFILYHKYMERGLKKLKWNKSIIMVIRSVSMD